MKKVALMERLKTLNCYQKIVLLLVSVMFVVFTLLYYVVSSRVGYAYRDAILLPHTENESVIYNGRVQGEEISITVTADKTVTFNYENKVYGPYTAKEDASAIPEASELSEIMTGVEILQGEKVFFRGGVFESGGSDSELMLFDEEGGYLGLDFSYSTGDGIEQDMNGNPIDRLMPSAADILELMRGPELTSKGDWTAWFYGVVLSVLTVVFILFADDLFRRNLSFLIQNAENAEPSEFEIGRRYLSWTILPVGALILYVMGLT